VASPRRFSWLVAGKLAASGFPGDLALRWLAEQGIRAVLSLSEQAPADLAEHGFAALHVSVLDASAPTPGQIDQALAFIAENEAAGRPVLVHCLAGLGRTGTILACYLVATGLGSEDAIDQVRQLRPGSIETEGQEAAVRQFAERLGR
jgi:atypical dual specificity phosphatase